MNQIRTIFTSFSCLCWITFAISFTSQLLSTWSLLFYLGFCLFMTWYSIVQYFDWEYLKNHEEFVVANICYISGNNWSLKAIDTGVIRHGKSVILDLHQDRLKKELRYLGRWTAYLVPGISMILWRDNLRATHCWYYTKN